MSSIVGHEHDHIHVDEKSNLISASASASQDRGHGSIDHGHCDHAHSSHEHTAIDHGHYEDHIHSEDHGHSELDHYTIADPASASAPSDINIQAAYLHVLTDTIQSIAVALAGGIIWVRPDWQIVDPIATFIFSVLVLYTTIPLLDRVFKIVMEGVPAHINWMEIKNKFLAIDGVKTIDHLHIWSLSSMSVSLSCHIKAREPQIALKTALKICQESGIDHPTIQVEDVESELYTSKDLSSKMKKQTCMA